jgi:hypothetical protein
MKVNIHHSLVPRPLSPAPARKKVMTNKEMVKN